MCSPKNNWIKLKQRIGYYCSRSDINFISRKVRETNTSHLAETAADVEKKYIEKKNQTNTVPVDKPTKKNRLFD